MQHIQAHKNNFDFLRFLFASFVIYTHSYALMGDIRMDPLYDLTGRVFSEIGVCGFFVISGYLIHQSLERSRFLYTFIRKRVLRIFPGLIVAVLFSVIIIGPLVSTLKSSAYFGAQGTWMYLWSNVLLIPRFQTLPGVFAHNPETVVNGSLWTLRYELFLYGLLSLLFFVSLAKRRWIIPIVFLICLSGFIGLKNEWITIPGSAGKFCFYLFNLGSYFSGGALLSLFPLFLQKNKTTLLLTAAVCFLCSLFFFQKELEVLSVVSFPLMVIAFGLHEFPVLNFSRYTGDISYGTYIYAYPLQQALIVWLQPENALQLMLPSFILSWLAGLLSWHLVEKRIIRQKNNRLPAPVAP